MAQGSAISLQVDRTINASELNSPHTTSSVSNYRDGVIRLPADAKNPCRVIGGPHNNACWWRLQLSHRNRNIRGAINWTHGTISPHLAAPTYGASPHGPVSHYLSFTASCIRGPGANVQRHPPLTSPLTAVGGGCWVSVVPHKTRPHHEEWNHTCNGTISSHSMWTYMVQATNTGDSHNGSL